MSAEKFDEKIRGIRKRLKIYRPGSVLQKVLDHLHYSGAHNSPGLGMPWIALFLLKLSMQESFGKKRDITASEFSLIANELYSAQSLAIPALRQNPHLVLRPMILQQAWYQGDAATDVKALTRQMLWYLKEGSPYKEQFFKSYGVSLEDFFLLSLYLLILVADKAEGVAEINLLEVCMNLSPTIPLGGIVGYLSQVSVREEDLPDFFKAHAVPGDKNQQSEFLQTTPLRRKPVLLKDQKLLIPNGKLFSKSIAVLVPDLLKKIKGWDFKGVFGRDMEAYIGSLLKRSGISYLSESGLNEVCRNSSVVSGKMADYMIVGTVNVILESKAIEPGDIVSAVFDENILRSHLKGSFIKAIEQCQESVYRLKLSKDYSCSGFSCVVATHEDFWFASAADVASFIDIGLEARMIKRFGELPIGFENIIFVTVDMVETVFEAHARGEVVVGDFFNECCQDLNTPEGRRFTMTHLIEDKLRDRLFGHRVLLEEADKWHKFFQDRIEKNRSYWIGKHFELMEQNTIALDALHRSYDSVHRV